jgi:GAF domain-containing protein
MAAFDDSAAFATLAAELQAESDEQLTANTIVARLEQLVPEARSVSLTVQLAAGHRTMAATDDDCRAADALQYALGEGPCVEAAAPPTEVAWIRSGNVRSDPRWPRWGPEAADSGIGSLLSVQLLDSEKPRGALNLYSQDTGAFADHDTVDLALVYAIHAANALASARLATNLQTALSSRHTIGMAQGIVMERFGLDEHQSFELLRRLSSMGEAKVRDVAAHIVATRSLPESRLTAD